MDSSQIQLVLQLLLALILGGAIGLEREYKRKEAGLQTYALVVLGSCVFTIISAKLFIFFSSYQNSVFNPSQIVLAIAAGIGFLGGGVIVHRESRTEGLTTAAGLWVAAAIGVAVGAGFYLLASLATLFALLVLVIFGAWERKFLGKN